MRRSMLWFAAAVLIVPMASARACWHRSARRCGHHPISYGQALAPAPVVYTTAPPVAEQAVVPTQPADAGVQPAYRYEVAAGQPAYYYTYDSSGKLIIQQWMDWVFRGGKEVGMPRPPLPIIGYFTRPR